MSSNYLNMYADQGPPLQKNANIPSASASGVYSRDILGAGELYKIPAEWKGNHITIVASADCQVQFGDSTAAITMATRSALSGADLTANAACGYLLKAGIEKRFRVPKLDNLTHFTIRATADGGTWYAYKSVNTAVESEL